MSTKVTRLLSAALLVVSTALLTILVMQFAPQPANAAANMSPSVRHTVLPVTCTSVENFDSNYRKIADFGDFLVSSPDATVEATFYGRVSVDVLVGASGAVFELRVDNLPTDQVWARAVLRDGEYSTWNGMPVSMSGVFSGLAAGEHTVSLWVRSSGNGTSGSGGRVDPGCWSSDHIVVREFAPFGTTFLPSIVH